MAKDLGPAVDADSVEQIEGHGKKGKPRKFFMIYKGATIKKLVVFKKGPFGPKVMQAKKNGFKGDVTYGVLTGSGSPEPIELKKPVAKVIRPIGYVP